MNATKFVSYLRVSTSEQGESGLGLEAQRQAVNDYLARQSHQLLCEFVEIESGSRNDRPQLKSAIELCKPYKATLIIAKLDRLARNVAFIATLMESGVSVIAADNPHANKLTIHILVAMAEHEAEMISARTKAALAAAKKRGVVLGGFRGKVPSDKHRALSAAALGRVADARAADLASTIKDLQAGGRKSLRAIADGLNEQGIPTARGQGRWSAVQVSRLLARIG